MLTIGVTLMLASLRGSKTRKAGFVTNLFLAFGRERTKSVTKMNWKASVTGRFLRAKASRTQSERRPSKFVNQVTRLHAEGFGYPQKRMKADPLLSPLNLTDINGMQIGLFRQPLLTQARCLAVFANGITQNFKLFRFAWHHFTAKQEGKKSDTPNMGLFCACHPVRSR